MIPLAIETVRQSAHGRSHNRDWAWRGVPAHLTRQGGPLAVARRRCGGAGRRKRSNRPRASVGPALRAHPFARLRPDKGRCPSTTPAALAFARRRAGVVRSPARSGAALVCQRQRSPVARQTRGAASTGVAEGWARSAGPAGASTVRPGLSGGQTPKGRGSVGAARRFGPSGSPRLTVDVVGIVPAPPAPCKDSMSGQGVR